MLVHIYLYTKTIYYGDSLLLKDTLNFKCSLHAWKLKHTVSAAVEESLTWAGETALLDSPFLSSS